MRNFDVFAASPENLGTFLGLLTVVNSPWESEFNKAFCAVCGKTDCTVCPHEKERGNPLWWLKRRFVDDAEANEQDKHNATTGKETQE